MEPRREDIQLDKASEMHRRLGEIRKQRESHRGHLRRCVVACWNTLLTNPAQLELAKQDRAP